MLKALDWSQKTFPLSARGKAVDQGKAVPGEKNFCRPPTSLRALSGSLGVLSLLRRYNLDFCVGIIFSQNVQRYYSNFISNCITLVAPF